MLAIAAGVFSGGGASAVLVPAAAGTLLLFIGVAMISSHLVPPLIWLVGAPARRLGGSAGRLASANSGRNPSRTAATAAALMIGLALVTFVAVLASGLESSATDDLNRQVKSDYVVTPTRGASSEYFDTATGRALASVPGVTTVSAVHSDKARVLGSTVSVNGIDGRTIGSVYRFAWKDGSNAVLTHLGDGAIVDSKWATKHKLAIGSPLAIETSDGKTRTFVIRATYHPKFQPVFSGILIDQAAFDRTFPKPQNAYTFVNAASGATPAITAGLKRSLARFSDVSVDTKAGWIATENNSIKLDARHLLRLPGVVGDRQPVRNGEHARAVRVRTDARDRDAAGDRRQPTPAAPDDPAGKHHHGADRCRAWATARRLPRRDPDPRDREPGHLVPPPGRSARDLHARRRHRRRHRGSATRTPRSSAERPRSTPVRVRPSASAPLATRGADVRVNGLWKGLSS